MRSGRRCCPSKLKARTRGETSALFWPRRGRSQPIVVDAGDALPGEVAGWQALLDDGQPLVIEAHTRRRVILDLDEYVCAYPQIQLSGGRGSRWSSAGAEALHVVDVGRKQGQRDGSRAKR